LIIKYIHIRELNSTNSFAKSNINSFSKNCWTVITADTQTAGRGQNNSRWVDDNGGSLLMTIISPEISWNNNELMRAHMSGSLALKLFLEGYKNDITLKWPNDIFFKSKKIAGILSESNWKKEFCNRFFFGIGINIRSAPLDYEYLGADLIPSDMIKPISEAVISHFELKDKNVRLEYEKSLLHWNILSNWENLITGEIFKAKTSAILKDGRMELMRNNGQKSFFSNKEVQWLGESK
tara:strand:- start:11098 stop:11808 length:711 start_codon:yes stop_codon:yes gene_type:complete